MNDFVELRKIITIALRWWWLVIFIAVTLLGAAAGYVYSRLQTPIYQATTTLLVGQFIQATTLDSRDIAASEQLALTYSNIVRLQPIMQKVTENLDLGISWQTLAGRVDASPIENTQLLEISVEAETPELASQIADEIAKTLILASPTAPHNQALDENQKFTEQRLEQLRINIADGQKRVDELEQTIPTAETTEQLRQIQREIDSMQSLLVGWENNYSRLLDFTKQSSSPNFLSVAEPAQAGESPIRPLTTVNMLVLGLAALALTFGTVIFIEFTKESADSIEDTIQSLGLIPLGVVGTLKASKIKDRLIIKHNLFSAVSEDYRLLRSKIQFIVSRWQRKVILVTSPIAGELKSVVTANLGIVMAQAGFKTIIVDANLRNPLQHEIFELANTWGLAEALYLADEDVISHLQPTTVNHLKVLTAGAIPILYPSELLSSARMGQLLDRLVAQADVVICDSAEAVRFADTLVLSSHTDGVVLVMDDRKAARASTEQAVLDLKQTGANLIGVVVGAATKNNLTHKTYDTATKAKEILALNKSYMNGKEPSVAIPSEILQK